MAYALSIVSTTANALVHQRERERVNGGKYVTTFHLPTATALFFSDEDGGKRITNKFSRYRRISENYAHSEKG
jgi:hypothetical protein